MELKGNYSRQLAVCNKQQTVDARQIAVSCFGQWFVQTLNKSCCKHLPGVAE